MIMKKLLILFVFAALMGGVHSQTVIEPFVTANKVELDSLSTDSVYGAFWLDGTTFKIYYSSTWNTVGFTDPMTTRGDILIRDASNATARLGIGANTYVLTSDGTDISWVAASSDTSYFDLTGAILSPKAGVDTFDIESEVFQGDGAKWFTDPHNAKNIALGQGAMQTSATHEDGNIAIGYLALEDVTTGGIGNLGNGYEAGKNITSGDYNTITGYQSGGSIAAASENTIYGGLAAQLLTGSGNVAIGHEALKTATVDNYNTAVGRSALKLNTGSGNTAVGYASGQTGDGSNCAFFGSFAGLDETGSNYIIIDNMDRGSEAAARAAGMIVGVTNATPANQTLQLGGGGAVSIPGTLTVTGESYGLLTTKSYGFTSQGVGADTYYVAGYYDAPAADANLTQASLTQTHGSANGCYAAHAFIVAALAGVTDGTDLILTVTGTSITDAGVRAAGDSEVIVADATAAALNTYYETTKKWIGQITFTLSSTAGTAYNFDFNYGFAKYEDFGNHNFTTLGFEIVGEAGATDATFNVTLYKHCSADWNYSAAAFSPTPTVIVDLQTVHNTEYSTISGDPFAFKRFPLSTTVSGSTSEGVIVKIVTGQNNTVQSSDIHIGVKFYE
jgi:hypothetical protein